MSARRSSSPPARLADALTVVVVVILAAVVVHNAFHYPAVAGYDAASDIEYARTLVTDWRIPSELRNYYTPPGFFLVAGALLELGDRIGMFDPAQLGQLLDGALAVGTAVLLAVLVAIVFPGRSWLRLASVAFYASCPIVLKTAAMFHPQNLAAFLAIAAVVLCARMIRDARYGLVSAATLGVVIGAGQLVRSVGIWTLGTVFLALLAAVVFGAERRSAVRALAVVTAVGVLVAAPWYVYLGSRYGNPVFGRSSAPATSPFVATLVPGRSAAPAPFRLFAAQRPPSASLWFYVDPGLPDVVTNPQRGALAPRFWPLIYTDMWGDYYGVWNWGFPGKPSASAVENRLTTQALAGVVPSLLAAAGLLALVCLAVAQVRSRTELLLVPLLSLVALAGTLYYAHGYWTPDGDTIKALFLLPAVPALAVCFGFAVETIGRRSRWLAGGLAVVLAVSLGISLAFGIA
jgi:hypothetical protein